MADNLIYIPLLNPVKFYETTRSNIAKYYTKHFDQWMFQERLYYWQQRENYKSIWQTDDIIYLQFESTFDPIVVTLKNKHQRAVVTLPTLIGIQNIYIANTYAFEAAISLAGLESGCYTIEITCGASGPEQKILVSDIMYISSTPIKNSICLEYWNSRYHDDVLFETGVKFQYRIYANFGFLEPGRKDEMYRDQRNNPTLLNGRSNRVWPLHFGDQFGIPDDIIDLLNRIWSCDNVLIDNKPFCIADGSKFEFITVDRYPKRGVKLMVEEGINRNSSIFTVTTDPTKKIIANIIVDAKVFGDLSNQGNSNEVPVLNVE